LFDMHQRGSTEALSSARVARAQAQVHIPEQTKHQQWRLGVDHQKKEAQSLEILAIAYGSAGP
ncbi:MAG: hypothetical protein ABR507_04435, partial [Actinomycetota bacterium]